MPNVRRDEGQRHSAWRWLYDIQLWALLSEKAIEVQLQIVATRWFWPLYPSRAILLKNVLDKSVGMLLPDSIAHELAEIVDSQLLFWCPCRYGFE